MQVTLKIIITIPKVIKKNTEIYHFIKCFKYIKSTSVVVKCWKLAVIMLQGSGIVYKGNKRPISKECILIIDHETGTFTLERLSNNINVKKTR